MDELIDTKLNSVVSPRTQWYPPRLYFQGENHRYH